MNSELAAIPRVGVPLFDPWLTGQQPTGNTDVGGTRRPQSRSVLTETGHTAMSIGNQLAHKADAVKAATNSSSPSKQRKTS